MLCRKFRNILFTKTNKNVVYSPVIPSRSFSKWFEIISGTNMTTSSRFKIFRDIIFVKAFNVWTRSAIISNVVRRYRRERGVKDMLQYFRQIFFKRKTHLLVYGAACTRNTEEPPGRPPKRCAKNIKDKEMKRYISDLDAIEQLSKATLFCEGCEKRIIIDAKHKGIQYCECPNSKPTAASHDGWMPFMETSDVIIWRKEYKPGGLFAYKVYGRYKHIVARDFALIQVDSAYRPEWDDAVASISTIEKHANGVHNQYIVHWEVLWPRLFTNRDYVYLRRHKEYTVERQCLAHRDGIFPDGKPCVPIERSSVHAHAKQASQEQDEREKAAKGGAHAPIGENKVYVIVSRSCSHPQKPAGSSPVRVSEYWSHMVVTSLHGPDQAGMEFVLTYYDEPAVGGMPPAITSWAMGRAGPAFMDKMRTAAEHYQQWSRKHPHQDTPDFSPEPANVGHDVQRSYTMEEDADADMEEEGKESEEAEDNLDHGDMELPLTSKEQSTQTRPVNITLVEGPEDVVVTISKVIITVQENDPEGEIGPEKPPSQGDAETKESITSPIIESLQTDMDSQKIILKEVTNEDTETSVVAMEQDRDSNDIALDKDGNSQEEKTAKVTIIVEEIDLQHETESVKGNVEVLLALQREMVELLKGFGRGVREAGRFHLFLFWFLKMSCRNEVESLQP